MIADELTTGIVTDSYPYGENQIVTVHGPEMMIHEYHFFFLPRYPDISFGDTLLMNFHTDRFWVCHGNPHLTYRLFPIAFPGTLLLELIQTLISEDLQ